MNHHAARLHLSREPFTLEEARATTIAAFKFRRGTPEFEGCRAGFSAGYGTPLGWSSEPRTERFVHGFWYGFDVGCMARGQDSRPADRGIGL